MYLSIKLMRRFAAVKAYAVRQSMVERDPSKVDFTKDGKYRLYPDDPLSAENKKEFLAREKTQFFDPCKEASRMSMACLDRNNYERTPCLPYFEAYRDCLKEWKENRKKR